MFQPMNFDGGGELLSTGNKTVTFDSTAGEKELGTLILPTKGKWLLLAFACQSYESTNNPVRVNVYWIDSNNTHRNLGMATRGTALYGGGTNNMFIMNNNADGTVVGFSIYDYGNLSGKTGTGYMQAYRLSSN